MRTISLADESSSDVFPELSRVLGKGGIIAYPTESYYALGVLATDSAAVAGLFSLKQRSCDKPVPVVVGNMVTLRSIVMSVPDSALKLMEQYWPGALTLIFDAAETVPLQTTAGTGRIAVRIPGESFALDMARKTALPITATSANISSMPPARNPLMVTDYFDNEVDLLIHGGEAPGGAPSTIVDATDFPMRLVRQGRVQIPGMELTR